MGTKFKVGDKVRVREDLVVGERYKMEDESFDDTFEPSMSRLRGKVVTIDYANYGYGIKEDDVNYNWTDEMFEDEVVTDEMFEDEVVAEEMSYSPIVIYHRGKAVIALDGSTGLECTAIAKDESFDFYEGALAAVTNLIEHQAEKSEESHDFHVGDLVIGLPEADDAYNITTSGWKGIVVDVDKDRIAVAGPGLYGPAWVQADLFRKASEEDL